MNCPTGKKPYASPQEAARALRCQCKRRNARNGGRFGKATHFKCRCGAWHTGHGVAK